MNTPEDYRRIGVWSGAVESWEDGWRDDTKGGTFEWWYFEAILDDGEGHVVRDGGDLIYEFAYVQDSCRELMGTTGR